MISSSATCLRGLTRPGRGLWRRLAAVCAAAVATLTSVATPPASEWFEAYAPGVVMADQGTVEMTMTFSRPIAQLGSSFDFAFKMLPVQPNAQGPTLLGLYVPTAASSPFGLYAIGRNATTTGRATAPLFGFNPVVGQPVRVAFSWGAGQLKIYATGQELGSGSFTGTLSPVPALFHVARLDPFNVSEIKISDVQLPLDRLGGQAGVPFAVDANTTLLASDNLANVQYFSTARQAADGYASLTPVWTIDTQCVVAGVVPTYPLVGFNRSGAARVYSVAMKATDVFGNVVLNRTENVDVAADGIHHAVSLSLPELAERGHYKLEMTVTDPVQGSKVYNSALAVLVPNDQAVADGALDRYLGYHYALADHSPQVVNRMGLKTDRVFEDLSGFGWFAVEPEQGRFTWARTDLLVARAKAANIEMLGILGSPPPWAAVDPGEAYKAVDSNWTKLAARWKPRDMAEWGNYVYQVVSRYKNDVKNWEIWNEVDWHPPARALTFSGSTAEYLEMLRVAYAQAKLADPTCNVLISGFGLIGDTRMAIDLLDADAAPHFDTFNMHAYSTTMVDELRAKLNEKKQGAPFWMTEQMWNSVSNESNRLFLTASIYLSFMEKEFGRFYQFGYSPFAFDSSTLSPTIDTYVTAVFQSQLRKCNGPLGKYTFTGSNSFAVRHYFTRTDGKILSILGQEQTHNKVTISGSIESAVDIYGKPVPMVPVDGGVKLDIANVAYIISAQSLQITGVELVKGAPYILNGGFDDLSGDVATGGLEAGKPVNWTLRETNTDPQGKIVPTAAANNPPYAMSLKSSGAGRVYLFQDTKVLKAGNFRLSAYVRRPNAAETAIPYLSVFDRDRNVVTELKFTNVPAGGGYTKVFLDISFDAERTQPVALICGIAQGQGTLLVDDVDFVETNAAPPTGLVATPGGAQVSLAWTALPGATSYDVKSATVSGGPYIGVGTVTGNQFTHYGLSNGTTYYYVVSAVGSAGVTSNSAPASATPVGPMPATIIVDNSDATGVTITGSWGTSTGAGAAFFQGINYLHDGNTGAVGGKSVRFTPNLAQAGSYEVYLRWSAASNRASNVPVDIISAGGTTTLTVNQRGNPSGGFVLLGTYNFNAGTTGSLLIRNTGTDGFVIADAVKFQQKISAATVTLGNLSQTYDGTPRAVTWTTAPADVPVDITYAGASTVPVAAGSYPVVANVNTAGYTGYASGTLVIAPAPATIALGNLTHTYDGAPKNVTTTTAPAGLAVTVTYNGSATPPTNAGSYTVAATVTQANYIGSASGTLVIAKAPASIALGALAPTYDGTPKNVTTTTSPAGLPLVVTYNGSATAPTNAGAYAIAATINHANYVGSAAGTLTIAKATASIDLAPLVQVYNGTPRPVTATTIPADLNVTLAYDGGGASAPVYPGPHTVTATINDINYTGTKSGVLVIAVTALVRHAPTLNGNSLLDGSVQVLSAESVTINGGSSVSSDLLLPGTPAVQTHGHSVLAGTRDGPGAAEPTHHVLTLNGEAVLRYLVRRIDAIAMPSVAAPPAPTGTRSVTINHSSDAVGDFATLRNLTLHGNAGRIAVPPGVYGQFVASGNAGFVLGVAGATEPTIYDLQSLALNGNATLEVAGPITLRLAHGVTFTADVGHPDHPEWLALQVHDGGVALNGSANVNGFIVAPNGTVVLNGGSKLTGGSISDGLALNGHALLQDPKP